MLGHGPALMWSATRRGDELLQGNLTEGRFDETAVQVLHVVPQIADVSATWAATVWLSLATIVYRRPIRNHHTA